VSRKNLNTLAIEDFLQNVKIASKKQTRELKLDQKQYKDLADSISMVLARLVELQDSKPTEQEAISIQMDGGKL
jgi:galactose-1-phosphate uridylyltransferase